MPLIGSKAVKMPGGIGGGSNKKFTSATGGTITTVGDYKIHTFTSPGTYNVKATVFTNCGIEEYIYNVVIDEVPVFPGCEDILAVSDDIDLAISVERPTTLLVLTPAEG